MIPPPPAPLNIPPSRARRQLAARLALHKQRAEEASTATEEAAARNSDDPFASLGDRDDDGDASDPFTLDEEEEDITASGRRDKKTKYWVGGGPEASPGGGVTNLFSSGSGRRDEGSGYDDEAMVRTASPLEADEDDERSSDSDNGERHPLEATRSQERVPLETDDYEDEEMGEMVAPSQEDEEEAKEDEHSNSSDGQEQGEELSPSEAKALRGSFGSSGSGCASKPVDLGRHDQQREHDEDEEDEESEGLVEIVMPSSGVRRVT